MSNPIIDIQRVQSSDLTAISRIADWYLSEWKIPKETTVQKISNYPDNGVPYQLLLSVDGVPAVTGGLYHHVSLLDHDPYYKQYGPWLALVYTVPEYRNKGYGGMLCWKIQAIAKEMGLKEMFLYTFTAESLYRQLGWKELQRLDYKGKDAVVMKMELQTEIS